MEYLCGPVKIKDIFLSDGNWWRLFIKKRHLIRFAIIANVVKLLACRTSLLGFHRYICPDCNMFRDAPHTCKCRLCPPCGKKATDMWIANANAKLPDTTWQHITFTLSHELQDIIWANRWLMGLFASCAAGIILGQAKKKNLTIGIYLAIHTFGRDIKRNFHVHLSCTVGGLSKDGKQWKDGLYFHHETLKTLWKYEIVKLIRDKFKAGKLRFPSSIAYLSQKKEMNRFLDSLWQKTWVVHLNEQSSDRRATVAYLGKYLKRPPIGETRIKSFQNGIVSFEYLDHYTGETATMNIPAQEFLERLISHIPDKNFRNIRYYGFLSNRTSGKLMPIVRRLLGQVAVTAKKLTWRNMLITLTGKDPLKCRKCGAIMILADVESPLRIGHLLKKHEEIAHGYFQMA